ncbi:hemin uptake protein HemP [Alienimonas sp. DA493]|uniref:hemin uptake protein HemP n=1 Tax=Alienimonas sp. DA493 TaxID=3373605 RepID=UPI003754B8EB
MPAPPTPDPPAPQDGTPPARPAAPSAAAPPPRPERVRFEDLAGGAVEIEVEHAGQVYRLRRTRADKLLLTK